MNKALIIPVTLLLVGSTASHALVNLGEGRIDLNLQVSAFYDTEIQSRNLGQEDFVFSIRPSLVYSRPSKNLDITASVGLDSITYLDYDQYNDTNFFFDLDISPNARMETSRFVFTGKVLLNTETRSEPSVGEIITFRNYGASGELKYDPNRRYTLIGSASYKVEDPDSNRYSKIDRLTVSGKVQVPVKESLNLEGSISYLDTASDGTTIGRPASDSQTFTYSAGLSGALLPKVRGGLSAGFQNRRFGSGGDDTSPYFSANLDWAVDDLSSLLLRASQEVGTSIDDRNSETFSITLTARRQLSRDLSGSLYIGYEDISYDGLLAAFSRDDEELFFGGRLTYQLVRWGSIGLDARYADRTSTEATFEYDRIRVGLVFNGRW